MNSILLDESKLITVSEEDCSFEHTFCSICLQRIFSSSGDKGNILKCCNTIYHVDCLNNYLKTNISCPSCSKILIPIIDVVNQVHPTLIIYLHLPNSRIYKTYWNAYTPLYSIMKFLTHLPTIRYETLYLKIGYHIYKATESYQSLQIPIINLVNNNEQAVYVNRLS